jgi:hypothetical protein
MPTFSLTINRRRPDGSLQQVKLIASLAPGEPEPPEDEIYEMLFDLELQANCMMLETLRPSLRVWIEESNAA